MTEYWTCNIVIFCYLARSVNLPKELYVLLALISFLFFFNLSQSIS